MSENGLKSTFDMIFNTIPPADYLCLLRNELGDDRIELIENYFTVRLSEILSDIENEKIIRLPDLFFSMVGRVFFTQTLSNDEKEITYQYVDVLRASKGFRPFRHFEKKWRGQPRIYTTFYSMTLLKLIGKLETFLSENNSWYKETLKWIISLQPNERCGAFIEPDCPMVEAPELCSWALNVIVNLNQDAQLVFTKTFDTSKTWLLNFLKQRKKLSATRIFYCLNTLRLFFSNAKLNTHLAKNLTEFLEALHYDKGFHEFLMKEVKAQYRGEESHTFDLIHSTFFSLKNLAMLGYNPEKYSNLLVDAKAMILGKGLKDGGYGVAIQVKDYELFPVETPFETLCALLLLTV